jgi:D-serine deaminase-like pyridoxal phosphate-dependent protein
MTYPAAGGCTQTNQWLGETARLLREAGLAAPVISSGGTPDLWSAHTVTAATEHRAGSYIYMDRSQVAAGACSLDECALRVLATVVSAPAANRVILDAGSKALSSDMLGLEGFGHIPSLPDAIIRSLSEEHAVVDLPAGADQLEIGTTLEIIPNHACVVSNLFDHVHLVSHDGQVERIAVAARGRVD